MVSPSRSPISFICGVRKYPSSLCGMVGAGAGPSILHFHRVHELLTGGGASMTSFFFPSSVPSGFSMAHRGKPRGGRKGSWAPSSPNPGEIKLLLFLARSMCSQRMRIQVFLGHCSWCGFLRDNSKRIGQGVNQLAIPGCR